eukprot:scaffold630_cov399-Prasinococcus_capsulatus_cf.AAC.18
MQTQRATVLSPRLELIVAVERRWSLAAKAAVFNNCPDAKRMVMGRSSWVSAPRSSDCSTCSVAGMTASSVSVALHSSGVHVTDATGCRRT